MSAPKVYSTLLLWLLSELFERLPEVGDQLKPKMVFFFDEAHLLFSDVPNHLLEKIEQVVRLIRSKGIGVYFVTQHPRDIPDNVLGQLGNRVQHALRAFTPREQKALQAAAQTFRPNPNLDTGKVLTELGVGEALVSFLDEKGQPAVVERAFIVPPRSQIGPITPEQRRQLIQSSVAAGAYEKAVDRESAYELLATAAKAPGSDVSAPPKAPGGGILDQVIGGATRGITGERSRRSDTVVEAMAKSVARSIGSSAGRALIRGILGSLFGKGR
jgi:DNA helicase HerA-like ATPase